MAYPSEGPTRNPDAAPAEDNWRHRSIRMRCGSCMWFVLKTVDGSPRNIPISLGRCRRHSPTLGGFPVAFQSDWCGDHRLDENKC